MTAALRLLALVEGWDPRATVLRATVDLLTERPGRHVTVDDVLRAAHPDPDKEPDWGEASVRRAVWKLRHRYGFNILTSRHRGYVWYPRHREPVALPPVERARRMDAWRYVRGRCDGGAHAA